MSKDEQADTLSEIVWAVETMRLTGLLPDSEDGIGDWWMTIVGDEPDATSATKGGVYRATGSFLERTLSLVTRPGRVDWILSASTSASVDEPVVTIAGPVSGTVDVLRELAQRWVARCSCPAFQRLAFGCVLLSPVQDKESGYRKIGAMLPDVRLDPVESRDFSYQINRRRPFAVPDQAAEVNRLSKWSVASYQAGTIALAPRGAAQALGSRSHLCRLELDINTDAEYDGRIESVQLGSVLDELAELALEISLKGDTP